jgi:hypothetical protein
MLVLAHLVKFFNFYETLKDSLLFSQESTICSCPEPDESNLHHNLFIRE